jgi:hypothetical protein
MADKKRKVEPTPMPKPKAGKTRVGNLSNPNPGLVTQGNQGATFDKIMKQKYDWWK